MTKFEFTVMTEGDLDNFDHDSATQECGHDGWYVRIFVTGEHFEPVYHIRENGDYDGLEGWK